MKLIDNGDSDGLDMMPDHNDLAVTALGVAAQSAAKAKERGDKAKAEAVKNNEKKLAALKLQNKAIDH